jgi:L-fucose isomerase
METKMIRLGLLSFSDGRERVHEGLAPEIRKHERKIKEILEATGEIELVIADEIVHSAEAARQQSRQLASQYLDGTILNIAVFAFPNYVVLAAQEGRGPYLLLGPQDSRYPGLTGLLAAGGALNQVGIQHQRLWGDLGNAGLPQEVLAFARAAAAATRLRGQVYGLVGGRSIGMYTGAAPAELWQRLFGVDVDHVDQSEIVRLAPQVSADEVRTARQWLEEHVSEIVYDGAQLTPEKLDFQLRCYIALKEIVDHYQFDFVGLKCHFDMSEFFSVQCLSAAFLNDPYDWRGPKQPVPLACEADSDGALTMQMLKLISGKPSCLLDLRFFDREKGVYVMPNCGAVPTWFAARSDGPAENLARVRLVPSIAKYAGGGAHVQFVFAEGELTLARLTRSPEGYQMIIMKGETEHHPVREVVGASPKWPHAFVRLNQSPDELVQNLHANHVHAVAGDFCRELTNLCHILNIPSVVLDNKVPGH